MDKSSLVSTFTEAAKSGWSLCSDVQVLNWLEDFNKKLQKRAGNVTEEVQKLLEQTGAIEQDLHNTFNSFRGLSNTQFIENCICEEDEMEAQTSDCTVQLSEVGVPAQRYEEDIIPRYKEALFSGWNAYKQHLQKTYRDASAPIPHRVGWSYGQLPHIIGTDEFMRDNSCGLTEEWSSGVEQLELDSDAEREGIYMAAEMVGTGTLLEGDLFGTESDRDDVVGMEPAVSAALDFKAMLEAALRSPYIPYADDIPANLNSSSGYYSNMEYGLAASPVSVDSLRNGFARKNHELDKNPDPSKGVNATSGMNEDVQIYDIIAETTTPTFIESVPEEPHPEHRMANKEPQPKSSTICRQADVSSEGVDPKYQSDSSSFAKKLQVPFGGFFDNGGKPSSSAAKEYVHVQSQPVEISPIIKSGDVNEKAKLKILLNPQQRSIFNEDKNDEFHSSSSHMRLNSAAISEGLFHNRKQSTSSSPQRSYVLLEPIEVSCSSDLACPRHTSTARGRDTPSQEPGNDLSDSHNFSRQPYAELVSGGLFDDDDKLASSSPMESVCVWSQPTVPEGLFDSVSHAEENEVTKDGLIEARSKPDEETNSLNIKVFVGESEFPGPKLMEQASQLKDQFDANGQILRNDVQILPFKKLQSSNQTLTKSLSLFQTGLFDDGDIEEYEEPLDLFKGWSAPQQKRRSHEACLVGGAFVEREPLKAGAKINEPIALFTNLSEKNNEDGFHGIDAESFGRVSPMCEDPSNILTRVPISGVKGGTSDLDNVKRFGPPVNLMVTNNKLDSESDPFLDTLSSVYSEVLPHSVAATSTLNQSGYDSDSWSSSSSDKHVKSNPTLQAKKQAIKVSNSELHNEHCENISLDVKGISDPLGDSAFTLQVNGDANIAAGASGLESIDGSVGMTKEDIGDNEHCACASLAGVESLSIGPYLSENRNAPSTMHVDQMNDLFETKKRHGSWSHSTQPEVDDPSINESDVYTETFHLLASPTLIDKNLADGFVCSSVPHMEEENITTTDKSVAMDTPMRTGFQSRSGQVKFLLVSDDTLQESSKDSLAKLNDVSPDAQMLCGTPQQASVVFRELTEKSQGITSSMPSASYADRGDGRDIYPSPSDEETKSKLSAGFLSCLNRLTSHPKRLTGAPSLFQETEVSPVSSLLFGDSNEEEESSLFGPFSKTNPMIESLLKGPGKQPSLFDSDEE